MKRPMFAVFALGFGLLTSIAGAQTASAMVAAPALAVADTTAVQGSPVSEVQWRRRPGYRWRRGYGWVPLSIAGALIAGATARAYYGPGPYYYGPGPYYYGPGPYYNYGPGPYYYGPSPYYYGPPY